jgi:hypothetical protein
MTYANLGRQYASLGATELGAQNIARAYELRNRVSDPENYFITFNYNREVTRNLELARQTLESWVQQYPRDLVPHGFFGGFQIWLLPISTIGMHVTFSVLIPYLV